MLNSRLSAGKQIHGRLVRVTPHGVEMFPAYPQVMKNRKHMPTEKSDITPPVAPVADFDQSGIDFPPCPEEVARKAYFTYVNAGSAQGNHVQHWLDAEAQIMQERDQTRIHGFHNRT